MCLNAVPEGETSERFHCIQLCLSTTDCWHSPLHQKGSLIRPALLVKSVFTHFLLSTHLTCGHGYGCLLPSLEVSPVTGLLRDRYDKVFITQVLTLVSTEIITSGCNYSLMLPTWQATHGGYGWVKPSYPLNQLPLYLGLLSPSGTHMRGNSVFLTRVLPVICLLTAIITMTCS